MAANFIADTNRWNLPEPPAWFLKRLFDFDAQLVIIPSRRQVVGAAPAYLLCRRRQHTRGLAGNVVMVDNQNPDTNMCVVHGVLPIAPLRFRKGATTFTEAGCTSLLAELHARDTWAVSGGHDGNADAVVDRIEDVERAAKYREHQQLRDAFHHRARDAYRSLKARTGQRNKRACDYHGTARSTTGERVIATP